MASGTVGQVTVTVDQNPRVVPHDLRLALDRVAALTTENARLAQQVQVVSETNTRLRDRALKAEKALSEAQSTNAELAARITQIEAQILSLPKNSSNSSTPPSADKPGTARKYPSRTKSGKKTGGQPGHKGTTSSRLEPTARVVYTPEGTCDCGAEVAAGTVTGEKTRQVVGIEVQVSAVDHVVQTLTCTCGVDHIATVPEGVFPNSSDNPVVYDTSVKALSVGLVECAQVPAKAAVRWLDGMLGITVSEASVRGWVTDVAASLDGWDTHVVALLRQSPVVGADETPIRVEGYTNAHAHVAVTPTLTRFHLGGRAKTDIVAGGVLADHRGTLVCDGLTAYRGIGVNAIQTCVAHLLRELLYHTETFTPRNRKTPHPYPQFGTLRTLLAEAVSTQGHGTGPDRWAQHIQSECDEGLALLAAQPTSVPVRAGAALLRRIRRNLGDGSLLLFTIDPLVPPTNNSSEQAVRPLKVRQRRSGTRRSVPHTRAGLRIAGYLDTARKNEVTPETALRSALVGTPYLPPE